LLPTQSLFLRQHFPRLVRPTNRGNAKNCTDNGAGVTEPDEQRLLCDLRAGQTQACGELIRMHYQAVYRLLAHLTRDAHQAEDLTQETFAVAWQKIGKFQGKSSLGTWLHRIAYTKFVDAQRARRRAENVIERIQVPDSQSADPLENLAANEESRQLRRALDALDTNDRALLVLHYLQGLSYREMAVVLEEPAGTVKWRTHLALGKLRQLLPDEVEEHASRQSPGSGR
jgi:RNA polymerase sigma-70 factor (ECF subfamily)